MPRYFRLTADVQNPQADRRSRDWFLQPVFVKGQKLRLNDDGDRVYVEGGWAGPTLHKYATLCGGYVSKYGDKKAFEALLAAPSETLEQNATQWLKDRDVWSEAVLARLVELGKVTKAAVLDLQAVLETEYDTQESK